MSHLSQNLERLIQMISIEQLLGLVKQNNTSSDILTTPIVQKVVKAYEEELHTLNTVTNPNACVKDYSEDIAKIHEQLAAINSNLLHLADAIKNIHIRTNVGLSYSEAKVTNEVVANEVDKSSVASLEEEHVRLKIEEKQVTTVNESDDESSLASLEEEVEEELEADEEEEVANSSVAEEEEVEEAEEEVEESEKEISDEEEEEEVAEDLEEEVEESVESEEVEEESEKEISDEESEEEEEVEEVATVASLEEDEEEVFEIEIDDVTYYATSEENGILYEVDADGEVGKKVGIIKDGEPIFS